MGKRYKKTRVSTRQWAALFVANGWRYRRLPLPTVKALIAKGLMAEGPSPDPPQYHLTCKGHSFVMNMILDGYLDKDVTGEIYPTAGTIGYAVEREIDRRHHVEETFKQHSAFSDMPYKRTYATVALDGGVRIRVPVEEVYWDVPGDIDPIEKVERRIRGEKFDATEE